LSCTPRGAGLSIPPAFAEAASRRQAEREGNRLIPPPSRERSPYSIRGGWGDGLVIKILFNVLPQEKKSCHTRFNPLSQDISFDFPPIKIPYKFVSYQNNIEIFCSPELAYFLLKEIKKRGWNISRRYR
jgi:hypothetical protein